MKTLARRAILALIVTVVAPLTAETEPEATSLNISIGALVAVPLREALKAVEGRAPVIVPVEFAQGSPVVIAYRNWGAK